MKSNNSILEVEFDLNDRNIFFRPFGANLRGRKDFMRMARHDMEFVTLANQFPRGVPGTLLRIDLENESVTLVEPLQTKEWTTERENIEDRGIKVPGDIEIQHAHLPDWLWEVKRALDYGYASIVQGELPKDLGVEKPRNTESAEDESAKDDVKALVGVVKELVESLKSVLAK